MKKVYLKIIFIFLCMQPICASAEGFAAIADLLLLRASEESAATWATFVKETGRTTDLDATNVDLEWDPGFRLGTEYESKNNVWDSELYWTYVPSKANSKFGIGRQIVVPEFFSGFLSGNIFFGAKMDWRITVNMVDFAVGHKFAAGNGLTIRPSIGVKTGTIYQTINCSWYADIYTATEYVKHNFAGIGPSFAVDTRWNVYKGFSLMGDFATAFMWGNWRIKDTYQRPAALGLVTATTITTSMNNSKLGTMMFAYVLGLEWKYTGRSDVTLQLGYEMQLWTNQLRLTTFQQLPVHGDLTLQGGTCRIRVDL
jgi:hypothetical protein